MIRVVITGATGFVGGALLERVLRDGVDGERAEVVVIARRLELLPPAARAAVTAHALDLAEAPLEAIVAACGQDALVFHCAANASVNSGAEGYRNNVQSTERLLAALQRCAPRRVVYVSSIGAVDRAPADACTALLDEDAAPHPLTTYGAGKLAGEQLVRNSGLAYAIVRPTWVYGPRMRADSHVRVFLDMVRRGSLAARINFPGRVSLVHVDDLCTALLIAGTHDSAVGQAFFATDGDPVAIGMLFQELGEITGRKAGALALPSIIWTVARRTRRWFPLSIQCLSTDVLAASNQRIVRLGYTASIARRRGLGELARHASPSGGRWIVTGAASGIGRALAVQLHGLGHSVIAVDRNATGLRALQMECPDVALLVADLATTDGQELLARAIDSGPLTGLVNCAGIGARGIVADVSTAAQQRIIDLNITALADASSRALRRMAVQPDGGTLVNVASSAALQPLPGMAAYAASKAFVLSFSEAAAEEMAGTRIRIITACPGGTDTGFQAASGVRKSEKEVLMPAADVAAEILTAIQRRRSATILIGSRTRMMALMARVLPRATLVRLWGRLMRSMR